MAARDNQKGKYERDKETAESADKGKSNVGRICSE